MKKILVAEDNDSNFILMTYILKKYYAFDRAKNGKEAVDMVDSGIYDMVLMDINTFYQDVIRGAILILAVFLDARRTAMAKKQLLASTKKS